MTDEFGQRIVGTHAKGDTIVDATDKHPAVFAKDSAGKYEYLKLDGSGNLSVNVAAGGSTNVQYAVDTAAGATDTGTLALVVRDDVLSTLTPADGDYTQLRVTSTGALWVDFTNTTIGVTFTRLDYSTDSIAIKGSTGNQLAVNADGSINVSASGASDSLYYPGSINAVKDTIVTVVTHTPASTTEYMSYVTVSAPGYAEWSLKFGTTSSETEIVHVWTTPSCPTLNIDLPDYLKVLTTQSILVRVTNREKAASPASDFTAYATIVKKV